MPAGSFSVVTAGPRFVRSWRPAGTAEQVGPYRLPSAPWGGDHRFPVRRASSNSISHVAGQSNQARGQERCSRSTAPPVVLSPGPRRSGVRSSFGLLAVQRNGFRKKRKANPVFGRPFRRSSVTEQMGSPCLRAGVACPGPHRRTAERDHVTSPEMVRVWVGLGRRSSGSRRRSPAGHRPIFHGANQPTAADPAPPEPATSP